MAFSPLLFFHLYEFFKLSSSKLWLFLEFDCLKYYNGNGKARNAFYEKILNTAMLTVHNQGNLLTSLAKGRGRGAISLFYMVQVSKGS